RALRLEPWYAPGRDDLALRLWRRGEQDAAVAALEESFYRLPCLVSHAFLGPETELTPDQGPYVVRALADGDVLGVRLAILDPPPPAAVERHRTRPRPRARRASGRGGTLRHHRGSRHAAGGERALGGGRGHAARRGTP